MQNPLTLPDHAHLSALEVAAFLHVKRITVYRMIEGGELPCLRWGHVIRIPRDAFLKWYEQHGKAAIG